MKVALITGSAGLVGSQCCRAFAPDFDRVIGIDNDLRKYFFGTSASTAPTQHKLLESISNFNSENCDIRDNAKLVAIFEKYGKDIGLIVHTAGQPSHDWAANEPHTDFSVNATGTLNLLEGARQHCPKAVFIFTSTNKVYGDTPNFLPLIEKDTRWELSPEHIWAKNGVDESMSIDQSKHSLFGASKVAADVLVQEYGRYFGMNTGVFRCGCITGPEHAGAKLHGFLSYLVKCAIAGENYTILGYKGKQVRDNIHSYDLAQMFRSFYLSPKPAAVYNAGGSRFASCSIIEAINICEELLNKKMKYAYSDQARSGDHQWWISDVSKFRKDFPTWNLTYDIRKTIKEIVDATLSSVSAGRG